MNNENKSKEKKLPPYFSVAEKNRIFHQMQEDLKAAERFKGRTFSEAVNLYAMEIYPVEELSASASLKRLDADIVVLDEQIAAVINSENSNTDEAHTVMEGFANQRRKLLELRNKYIAQIEVTGMVVQPFATANRISTSTKKQNIPSVFRGKAISVTEAIDATHILVDYYEALKSGTRLGQTPNKNLAYLLRCNAITRLYNETTDWGLSGLNMKKWTLTDAEVVYTWLYAHIKDDKKPLVTLGGMELRFQPKSKK